MHVRRSRDCVKIYILVIWYHASSRELVLDIRSIFNIANWVNGRSRSNFIYLPTLTASDIYWKIIWTEPISQTQHKSVGDEKIGAPPRIASTQFVIGTINSVDVSQMVKYCFWAFLTTGENCFENIYIQRSSIYIIYQ